MRVISVDSVTMNDATCPLCGKRARSLGPHPKSDAGGFACATCGEYWVHRPILLAETLGAEPYMSKRHLLSALVNGSKPGLMTIDDDTLSRLLRGEPAERGVSEKMDLILDWYASQSNQISDRIPAQPHLDYPRAWCKSEAEWNMLLQDIAHTLGYLKIENQSVQVTVNALRVDEDEYQGGVVDRIKAQIRRSKFMIADYTGNRGGVYLEAGFAEGLGLTVINTCEQASIDSDDPAKRPHFDVAHTNMIGWSKNDLTTFEQRLRFRIEALFGHGPRS